MYQDGILVAGSLETLVDLLVPTTTSSPERSYVFAFILCSRLFLRPYELLSRVLRVSTIVPGGVAYYIPVCLNMQIYQLRHKQLGSSKQVMQKKLN